MARRVVWLHTCWKKASSESTRRAVAARHFEIAIVAACASMLLADWANMGVWLLPFCSVGIANTGSIVGISAADGQFDSEALNVQY